MSTRTAEPAYWIRLTMPGVVALRSEVRPPAEHRNDSTASRTWDQHDRDKDVSLLNLPAESDWVLYAPLVFDRALINNALAYDISNQVGRYAVRTRFCEVYLSNNDTFSTSDYVGLYIFMEKIKRGPDRVNCARARSGHRR